MKIIKSALLISVASTACLSDSDLIKSNEGDLNFKPGDTRTVCWGCNSNDLQNYLGISYDDYAV